jgi:acetyl-CoA C-acetyltransferase
MHCAAQLGIDDERLNVNGGGIAMGHAMGATGINLLSTLADELERRDLSTGVVAISGAAGIGAAVVIDRNL